MKLWTPNKKIIRPAGMSRRGFLRALGVTATTVVMGPTALSNAMAQSASGSCLTEFYAYATTGVTIHDNASLQWARFLFQSNESFRYSLEKVKAGLERSRVSGRLLFEDVG